METLIGFEYEGIAPVNANYYSAKLTHGEANYCKEHLFDIEPIVSGQLGRLDREIVVYGQYLQDNYFALSEIRLKPVPLSTKPVLFVGIIQTVQKYLFKDTKWREEYIPNERHQSALANLVRKQSIDQRDRLFMRGNITGQFIDYNMKCPITNGTDGKPVAWESDSKCQYRGGGLHVNISPITPDKAFDFVTELHKRLFPLNEQFKFKGNYRQQMLFRYRDYAGTPGVEYMTLGINMDDIGPHATSLIFKEIFETVKALTNV